MGTREYRASVGVELFWALICLIASFVWWFCLLSHLDQLLFQRGDSALFAGVLLPGVVSSTAVTLGIAAFIAGFLTLVLRHPNEPEDGWDDGSVV